MSTSNNTSGSNTSSLQFNPASQSIYNMLTGGAATQLQGYINSPFSNPQYNLGAAQSQKGAQQAGANNMAILNQNQLAQGITGQAGAGWAAAQKAQTGRANQAMSSQANVNNVLAALQRQQSAIGTGLSFQPQLTGQSGSFNQTSTTSGLGTWLPQVLGAGMSAAMAGASGGMNPFMNASSNVANQSLGGAPPISSVLGPWGGNISGMNLGVGSPQMPAMNPFAFPSGSQYGLGGS